MSFLVFFSADRAFPFVKILRVVTMLALAAEHKMTTRLDHNLFSSVHADKAQHFFRNARGRRVSLRGSFWNDF